MIVSGNTTAQTKVPPPNSEINWNDSWTYIRTVADTAKDPILILSEQQQVLAVNESYCRHFRVTSSEVIGRSLYELGNGQWDTPTLRRLFTAVLPQETFFKGYEVTRVFPKIGKKVLLLNARHIYTGKQTAKTSASPLIMLTIEDISDMMETAEEMAKKMSASYF
jgi:two-component system, chemotaxis family, CheB/CheR fusion protein